jgi:hypothetical protein
MICAGAIARRIVMIYPRGSRIVFAPLFIFFFTALSADEPGLPELPAVPPAGSPALTVAKVGGTTAVLSWTTLAGAQLYDVARGSLSALRTTGSFTTSANNCLQNDRQPLTVSDAQQPAAGDSYWYVVRALNCTGDGSYNDGTQAVSRDAGINASGQCQPAACTLGTDTDADRLDNCYETNTGIYCDATHTGTNPAVADTDGDYLKDGDEVLGTVAGLNLPAMGASPVHRDLFFEYDWFDDNIEPATCAAHSHRPTAAIAAAVSAAYAAAPPLNPDGTTGIAAHHDYGQGAPFIGGNLVADADGVLSFGVNNAEFIAIKTANFASNRNGYFHYVVLPHRYNVNSTSSGQAELPGDDLIVSLYCYGSTGNVANTIFHENGHNLNIRHGGNNDCNYKPNYNSVMNYKYQFPGVDNNCDPGGNGVLDYSRGTRIALNEAALNENAGTCGNPPGPGWDWNGNAVLENPVSFDINSADGNQVGACGGTLTTLTDYNDWANIVFTGLGDADLAVNPPEIISCDNPAPPTPWEDRFPPPAAANAR